MTLFNARVGFWMGKDAAADPAFAYEDLGNALRKVRIDFKIPITFDETRMRLLHEQPLRTHRLHPHSDVARERRKP